jgi:predicted DCC family thiol-disulfide oxidoreductase YuxK
MVETERTKVRGWSVLGDFLQARYFTADTRFLGVFRIGFGILLCADLWRRFVEAREYYSNDGFFPNHFSLFRPMGDGVFSLLHAFSTLGEVRLVMLLMLGVFVSYTLGYRTKLSQVLAFLSITSLNARNLFVENGGDVLVNVMAGLTMFFPLGKRLSVDALLQSMRAYSETSPDALNDRTRPLEPERHFISLGIAAAILQLAVIYFFNAVHKSGVGWLNGSAIHYFLHQDRIVTALAVWLRVHAPYSALQAATYSALAIEFALPVILLFPFFRTWAHRLGLLLGIGLHGGIALTSRLGPFSYAMILFFVLFLGERDWGALRRWFGRPSRKRTVIFDMDCGICLLICRILKRLDPFECLTFVGNDQLERLPAGLDATTTERTVVVVDAKGRLHTEERAVFEIGRALPFGILLLGWLRLPGLSLIGRGLYRVVAQRRIEISVWLGLGACGIGPRPGAEASLPAAADGVTYRSSRLAAFTFVRESLLAAFIVLLAVQAANDNGFVTRRARVHRPEWVVATVNTFRLMEGWGMFAPEPPYDDGHLVIDGRTKDGRKLDPFTGSVPDFDPFTPVGWGHEQFWCDYNNRLRFDWHQPNRQHFKDYLRHWHEYADRPEDELVAFDVWWVHDKSPPPGEQRGEPQMPQKLVSHGIVKDSGARPWLGARRTGAGSK